jgi:hypothetical protein
MEKMVSQYNLNDEIAVIDPVATEKRRKEIMREVLVEMQKHIQAQE